MVWAIQIHVHGEWRTTSTCKSAERAAALKPGVANTYGAQARVQSFPSEAQAWK